MFLLAQDPITLADHGPLIAIIGALLTALGIGFKIFVSEQRKSADALIKVTQESTKAYSEAKDLYRIDVKEITEKQVDAQIQTTEKISELQKETIETFKKLHTDSLERIIQHKEGKTDA